MNNREKKPPISINDIGRENEPKAEKGALSYTGATKPPSEVVQEAPKTKGKINYTQLLIAVGMSVLLVLILGNFVFTSKQDSIVLLENQRLLDGKVGGLDSGLSTVQTRLNSETGRIDTLVVNQENFIQQSELQGLSNTLGSRIDSLITRVSGLENQVANMETNPTVVGGGLEYHLVGSHQIYVRVPLEGIYVARINLVYPTPHVVGNMTMEDAAKAFHTSLGSSRNYECTMKWNGGAWEVVSISFYTNSFNLGAGEESYFNIPFSGPPAGYTAYVEVLPGIVSTVTEDEGTI